MSAAPFHRVCKTCGDGKALSEFTKQGRVCAACKLETKKKCDREYSAANKDKIRAKKKAYDAAHLVRQNKLKNEWRQKNIERQRAAEARYRERNREQCNLRAAKWKKAKPHKLCEYTFNRSSQRKRATPPWADREAMLSFYWEAKRLTAETGVVYHVDHIVPLISRFVCGLHCEENLRVITRTENIAKLNRHWPDMPEELRYG